MIRTELKRAFCSKAFWMSCGITLVMLAFGSSDCLASRGDDIIIPKTWWIIYLNDVLLGMKTALPIFYPIVVMIPYVLSYRGDRDSGYRELILIKTSRKAYLRAKILAVASSAFATILLPCLGWIPVCRLLGVTDRSYEQYYRHMIHFAQSFYDKHPGWYLVMYAFHAALLGTVFAVVGLGLSAVLKNKYVALLLPFCYAIFASSILTALLKDTFIGKSLEVMKLMPLQMHYSKKSYPLGFWTVPIYEVALVMIGLTLFIVGDYHVSET